MIKVIIFALLMCILNTDAADGPACEATQVTDWFTGAAAQRHYSTLKDNLALYDITVKNSMMLYICFVLSQPNFFQGENPILQTDIEIILYALKKKSASNAKELAETFRDEDTKVHDSNKILDAFDQCLSEVNPNDLRAILDSFPNARDGSVDGAERRYKKKSSKRLSASLKYVVWKMESADQDPQEKHLSWFRGEAAKTHYVNLEYNLKRYDITVKNSVMLRVCCVLSQSDCFQKTDVWFPTDIATILYTLSQESATQADKLAKTFCEEDKKVNESNEMILDAFGRCVPDIRYISFKNMEEILFCLPDVYARTEILQTIKKRYRREGSKRFSGSVQAILLEWNSHPESDGESPQPLQECAAPMKRDVMSPTSDSKYPASASQALKPVIKRGPQQEDDGESPQPLQECAAPPMKGDVISPTSDSKYPASASQAWKPVIKRGHQPVKECAAPPMKGDVISPTSDSKYPASASQAWKPVIKR
ncbi:MAG: hypothetical protein OXC30_00480, partial [Alphaproteobacteria bacterium]|nr:hypothetical protein [Alphaproteobacteria bacterium]